MPYIVAPLAGRTKRFDIDAMLDGPIDIEAILQSRRFAAFNKSNTKTFWYSEIPGWCKAGLNITAKIRFLAAFNEEYKDLFEMDRSSLYTISRIPKHSGGFRTISAPCDELMVALRRLKDVFELEFKPMYHTSAFAFIKGRSTIDAIKKHQKNGSWWFLKTDFSKFFDHATEEFVWQQFSQVFPFCEIVKNPRGARELRRALNLCFLNGGLPQGSPISPFITNVMMIPIDYRFANDLRNQNGRMPRFGQNHFVYTRYVDDINISCKGEFDWRDIVAYMLEVLAEFNAPFGLNDKKTHYGSRNGRNWMLGLMLNKDNKITIGHKKKRDYRSLVHNFITSRQEDGRYEGWTYEDVNHAIGLTAYYREVEPEFVDLVKQKMLDKHGVDFEKAMREASGGLCEVGV